VLRRRASDNALTRNLQLAYKMLALQQQAVRGRQFLIDSASPARPHVQCSIDRLPLRAAAATARRRAARERREMRRLAPAAAIKKELWRNA
jgi:hypothetical protein